MKRRSGRQVAQRVEAGHELLARSPSWSSAAAPMRVMIRMLATTYGLSVTSMPTLLKGEPSGPIT